MTKRLYIETVGCQMNVLDSELVAAGLLQAGYELVDSPRQADTILFNTCSVRQHAEDKVYSALGRLKHVKERRPGDDHRRAGLHGAEGPGDRSSAGPRTSIWWWGRASWRHLPALLAQAVAAEPRGRGWR